MTGGLYLIAKGIKKHVILFMQSFVSALKIIKNSTRIEISRVPAGKKLIACGNGPSLKKQMERYLQVFQNNDVICVNAMSNTNWFTVIKPKYYCLMDPALVELPERLLLENRKIIDGVWAGLERVDWDMELVLPRSFQRSAFLRERLKRVPCAVQYINTTPFDGYLVLRDFFLRKQLCAPSIQTVMIAAVYYGICKGYDSIYLVGSEMNFAKGIEVDENGMLCFNDTHFYAKEHKRGFLDAKGYPIPIAEFFEADARVFRNYMLLEEYSKKMGVKIYNATPGSWVDAFERIDLKMIQ